jgi:hypothetical protein
VTSLKLVDIITKRIKKETQKCLIAKAALKINNLPDS